MCTVYSVEGGGKWQVRTVVSGIETKIYFSDDVKKSRNFAQVRAMKPNCVARRVSAAVQWAGRVQERGVRL